MSRNPLANLLFHFGVVRITREVMPFPLVLGVIIQFLGPISINDVPVSFGLNTIVLVTESRHRGLVSIGPGIFHQHGEIVAFQLFFSRLESSQGGQGRKTDVGLVPIRRQPTQTMIVGNDEQNVA